MDEIQSHIEDLEDRISSLDTILDRIGIERHVSVVVNGEDSASTQEFDAIVSILVTRRCRYLANLSEIRKVQRSPK